MSVEYFYRDSSEEAAEQMVASESLNLDAPRAECRGCDCEAKDPSRGDARSLRLLRRLGVGVAALPRLRQLLSVDETSPDCEEDCDELA